MEARSLVAVPLPNGTIAIVWILDVQRLGRRAYFKFVIMNGFFPAVPKKLASLRPAESLGGVLPGEENVWKGCFFGDAPKDFSVVGARALPPKDHPYFAGEGTMVFQNGEALRKELHFAWRLAHDRPAVEAEWAKAEAAREKAAERRRRTQTLPKMSRERIFARWEKRWSPAALREARRIFRDATRALVALQADGTKRQRIAVLKRIVTEFNALDDAEGIIETVERELIVERIEVLASLVGLTNDDEALTGHRDW